MPVPITYNISIDYDPITNRLENDRISGGNGELFLYHAEGLIVVRNKKEAYNGIIAAFANPPGDRFIRLSRRHSNFNIQLKGTANQSITIKNTLIDSFMNIPVAFNGTQSEMPGIDCRDVGAPSHGNNQPLYNAYIRNNAGSDCRGASSRTVSSSDRERFNLNSGAMIFSFDYDDALLTFLARPTTISGDYTGTVVFDGESITSRGGGSFQEQYTFNFKITKKRSLLNFSFPNSASKTADFTHQNTSQGHIGQA
ncbi:hypothetical protein HWQ48_27060, partial [Shewanella sp. E94]